MSLDKDGAQAWRARGIEAYQGQRYDEAIAHFEKVVASEPESVQAHLAVAAARMTVAGRQSMPPAVGLSQSELARHREQVEAFLREQASTNLPLAEKSLKRANELDSRDKLVIEYLCALYFGWPDPDDDFRHKDEAMVWLERFAEVCPGNKFSHVYCGLILKDRAGKLLPNHGLGIMPPVPRPDLALLGEQAGPLLDEASRHFSIALTIDPANAAVLKLLDDINSMRSFLIDPDKAARDQRKKLEERMRQPRQARLEKQVADDVAPAGASGTVTFQLSAESIAEDLARPFPPSPWRLGSRIEGN
jgi:tetratricopeptide (TPR) repeat protein